MEDDKTTEADVSEDVNSEANTESESSVATDDFADDPSDVEATDLEEETAEDTTDEESDEQGVTESFAEETASPTNESPDEGVEHESRSSKRIQQLLEQNRQLRAQDIAQAGAPGQVAQMDEIEANEEGEIEMTPNQLQQYINQSVQSSLQQERAVSEIDIRNADWHTDLNKLVKGTPELNPKNELYNKDLDFMLSELVRDSNIGADGQLAARVKPSQIWDNLQKSIDTAKTAGAKEARVNIGKTVETAAITNDASVKDENTKYSQKDLSNMALNDPRAYADLIENNLI